MLENKSLATSILEHLRVEIITSHLQGGQKLNENQLSSQLNVSRQPLREAFQILEQEHFIVSLPRRGRFVVGTSEENYRKIHAARKMIECHVIDLLKEENVRSLPQVELAITNVLKNPIVSDDPYEKWKYIKATDDFHIKLVESVNNEFISHFYGTIQFNIYRYHYWLRVLCAPQAFLPGTSDPFVLEHRLILNYIEKGEYEKAKNCLKSHMDASWKLMKENFSNLGNMNSKK